MTGAAMLIDALHTALENAEVSFNGRGSAASIFILATVHGLVIGMACDRWSIAENQTPPDRGAEPPPALSSAAVGKRLRFTSV